MAEDEGQTGNGSSSLSDDALRKYLLCRLEENERLKLDARLLVDDRLAERMLLAESELIDDYAAGRMESVEGDVFKKRFLVTESRREKLHFASALQDYAASQSATAMPRVTEQAKPSWREGFIALVGLNRSRAWAVAGSFAILILVVGLVWFVVRERRETSPAIASHQPVPTLSPQASPQTVISPARVTPSPTPVRSPETKPTPAEPAVPATIASFVLIPGAVRGGGTMARIAVPDGERDVVRLSLVLEAAGPGFYQAELATAEGQSVSMRSKLKASTHNGETRVVLDVPARLLRTGDYQIKVTRRKADGETEKVASYYFRALE